MNSAALVQSWSVVVRVDFVCLTRRAPFDVFFYVLLQIWPPVVLLQQRCCVADSGVSAIRWVVKSGNYPPLKFVVAGNNQCVLLPPVVVFLMQLVRIGPSSDHLLVLQVAHVDFFNWFVTGQFDEYVWWEYHHVIVVFLSRVVVGSSGEGVCSGILCSCYVFEYEIVLL